MKRDNLVLSPLFSTTHHNGNFFKGFTPTNNITPRIPETTRSGINFDDFFKIPADMNPELFNKVLDSNVENLRAEIQNSGHLSELETGQKDLGLDIDLINESYITGPPTKSDTGFKFPSQPPTNRSQQSFRRRGDLLQSPNSSFLQRKKI